MSKSPYKLPNVFVGCPYGGKFRFQAFKAQIEHLPFKIYFADTHIATKHLLGLLRTWISTVDFCIFDVSLWNPNVSLEIGLAEGLGAEYYILLNRRLSAGVPADIQGLQRIDYSTLDFNEGTGLYPKLLKYLVRSEHTYPRNIWDALKQPNRDAKFYFAMRCLAHFKESRRLTPEDAKRLAAGTYLHKSSREEVIEIFDGLGLIGQRFSTKGFTLQKNIYRDDLKIG